ncbi:MAG: hypothetical protein PH343_10710 [Nitrospira sp.]|nr:hypothetical protein [Nitrospira sp.]
MRKWLRKGDLVSLYDDPSRYGLIQGININTGNCLVKLHDAQVPQWLPMAFLKLKEPALVKVTDFKVGDRVRVVVPKGYDSYFDWRSIICYGDIGIVTNYFKGCLFVDFPAKCIRNWQGMPYELERLDPSEGTYAPLHFVTLTVTYENKSRRLARRIKLREENFKLM